MAIELSPGPTCVRPLPRSTFFRSLMRIPVPWVFVLGYLLGIGLHRAIFPQSHASAAEVRIALIGGAVLFLIGGGIAGSGLVLFHRERTTTTPGEVSKALVTRGPYRFTRNPMYVGLTLAYLGEMGLLLQVAPIIPLVIVIAYVHFVVIPVEERQLRSLFGDEYTNYCHRVRRWL